MAFAYRKALLGGLLTSLAMTLFIQGETTMAQTQTDKVQEGPLSMVFTKHCNGLMKL